MSAHAAAKSAVAAMSGGRLSPSQRSETQPERGAPMKSPTAVIMSTLDAPARDRP